jgi:integrase
MRYVQRRGSVYRFRRGVPERLRPIIGTREVMRSLKTRDPREADRWGLAVAAEVDRMFAEAEAALKNPAVRVYKALQQDAADRLRRPRSASDEATEAEAIVSALEKLEHDRTAEAATQRTILEAVLKRVSGREDDADNPPLSILFDRWKAERKPPAKTWMEWDGARRRFEQAVGVDLPVRSITKQHVRVFKDALLSSTSKRTGRSMSPATVQKLLNAVGSVLSWAVKQGYIDANPAHGVAQVAAKADPEDRRLPYDADDLKKLFSVRRKDGADHWLPLLALWTGARLEELGQLHVADVREEDGVRFLAIEPGDGKRTKTKSSRRRVPLHPELLRLGFLEYVERQRAAGQVWLFSELRPTSYGSRTAAWSKYWGRHARELGVLDKRKTFHSFRHGFKDAARAVMPEEHHDAITGHANGSVGRSYGRGVPLSVLAESMAKVRYAGLDLSAQAEASEQRRG